MNAQTGCDTDPSGGAWCTNPDACNYLFSCDPSTCATCDPFSEWGPCACLPIDSGVLFLLIGGGFFGAYMLIDRRKKLELIPALA